MSYDPLNKKQVAIFGAGIAGLTAAHELIERGFDVEVYECAEPSVRDRRIGAPCAIGGMARTQWARVERGKNDGGSTDPLKILLNEPNPNHPNGDVPRQRILFEKDTAVYADEACKDEALGEVERQLTAPDCTVKHVEVRGFFRRPPEGQVPDIDKKRAEEVAKELKQRTPNITISHDGCGIGYPHDWMKDDAERDYVSFHVIEHWIPGEHGFRFFPSFYRNLFDTMRRTPIADENEPVFQETPRTVLENVVPTSHMALATKLIDEPFPFKRQPLKSLQGVFDQVTGMLRAMGHSLDDMNRFHLKLFQYMTSCRARRAEYEKLSWYDFVEADKMSPKFRDYLESGAQTLVAMVASNCDARTYGTVSTQMIENQFAGFDRTDGTLNAPTSIAWFDHWHRYLETQGVRFRHGKLVGFEVLDAATIWPKVEIPPQEPTSKVGVPPQEPTSKVEVPPPKPTIVVRDYYVLALPAEVLQKLVRETPALADRDFDRIRRFNLGDPKQPVTGGALEHMSGIQFYLPTDFRFVDGHTILPDTPWRLSAIFQPQFWMQKRGWWSGYRGIVSVDISNWHQGRPPVKDDHGSVIVPGIPKAWECTRDEIAHYTRLQIQDGFRRSKSFPLASGVKFPPPLFYHIDDNMLFDKNGKPSENLSPFLMSRPGEYSLRPGKPGDYDVYPGNIVLAGTFMQTFTRLTTMEAANESGRHAANAILRKERPDMEEARIYDPEDYEVEDLKLLVEVDAQLHKLGLPHLVDILGLTEVPCSLLQPDCDPTDELEPLIDLGKSKV